VHLQVFALTSFLDSLLIRVEGCTLEENNVQTKFIELYCRFFSTEVDLLHLPTFGLI
jgi:hypothetical protein